MRIALPFLTFFSVLCGYFVLRPVRDEIGVRAGVEQLPWLFTATFAATLLLVPLFGWIVARVRRRVIATATYALCSALLLLTFAGLQSADIVAWGVGLFIGISVLNLFIISVFWSLMADSYDEAEARKMYGIIAVGRHRGRDRGTVLDDVAGAAHRADESAADLRRLPRARGGALHADPAPRRRAAAAEDRRQRLRRHQARAAIADAAAHRADRHLLHDRLHDHLLRAGRHREEASSPTPASARATSRCSI